jgi:hypothetical protein
MADDFNTGSHDSDTPLRWSDPRAEAILEGHLNDPRILNQIARLRADIRAYTDRKHRAHNPP